MIIDEAWAAVAALGLPIARDAWTGAGELPSAYVVIQEMSDVPVAWYDDNEAVASVYIVTTLYWSTPAEQEKVAAVKSAMRGAGFIRVSSTGLPFTENTRRYGYQIVWRKLDTQEV